MISNAHYRWRGLVPWLVVFAACAGAAQAADPAKEPPRKLRVVIFGAHCDDNELGVGGLMRMLADQGHEVISAYATAYRRGRMIGGKSENTVRRAESTAACRILGATPHIFPYAHEELEKPFADRKALEEICDWLDRVQPDIVVAHWPLDTHPNHQVVGMSTWIAYARLRAGWSGPEPTRQKTNKKAWNLYYYESNTFTSDEALQSLAFRPSLYLDIGKVRARKHEAVDCLKSQDPVALWRVQDNMHVQRGKECGVPYAEAYILVEAKPGCPLLPVPFLSRQP